MLSFCVVIKLNICDGQFKWNKCRSCISICNQHSCLCQGKWKELISLDSIQYSTATQNPFSLAFLCTPSKQHSLSKKNLTLQNTNHLSLVQRKIPINTLWIYKNICFTVIHCWMKHHGIPATGHIMFHFYLVILLFLPPRCLGYN